MISLIGTSKFNKFITLNEDDSTTSVFIIELDKNKETKNKTKSCDIHDYEKVDVRDLLKQETDDDIEIVYDDKSEDTTIDKLNDYFDKLFSNNLIPKIKNIDHFNRDNIKLISKKDYDQYKNELLNLFKDIRTDLEEIDKEFFVEKVSIDEYIEDFDFGDYLCELSEDDAYIIYNHFDSLFTDTINGLKTPITYNIKKNVVSNIDTDMDEIEKKIKSKEIDSIAFVDYLMDICSELLSDSKWNKYVIFDFYEEIFTQLYHIQKSIEELKNILFSFYWLSKIMYEKKWRYFFFSDNNERLRYIRDLLPKLKFTKQIELSRYRNEYCFHMERDEILE